MSNEIEENPYVIITLRLDDYKKLQGYMSERSVEISKYISWEHIDKSKSLLIKELNKAAYLMQMLDDNLDKGENE